MKWFVGWRSVAWWSAGLLAAGAQAETIALRFDRGLPQAAAGAAAVERALAAVGHAVVADDEAEAPWGRVVLALRGRDGLERQLAAAGVPAVRRLRPEGFSLRLDPDRAPRTAWVVGEDPAGLLYGAFELAERIECRVLEQLGDDEQEPHLAMRGVKFNIPLDVRTPSYTDVCDAAQENIGEMWSMDFWRGFIDALARHRYNFVSLWNLHPFPSMVRVPEYPEVALADVRRSTAEWKEHYPHDGRGFCPPEVLGQVETLRRMSIEDKMAFWRAVMAYGAEHNVRFYVVTWNLFTYGAEGKHGITESMENPVTTDYFRRSVAAMLREYPLLAGIGLTTGENMPGADFGRKERWAFDTYGRGVLDAARETPGRRITLIHRQHQTGAREIARNFRPLIENPDTRLLFSFKYARAHVMSSTRQTGHDEFVRDLGSDLKTIWTLRNDDAYHYRWAAPDFVREFILNLPRGVSEGFYYGSDQWVWGREFLAREPETPRQLEVDKHWLHWLLWGRLGYDPALGNDRLAAIVGARFPGVDGAQLLDAWQAASMTYPLTTGFHWGALDFQWFIEGCISFPPAAGTASGFHDVERFITLGPHPGTDNVAIPDYVRAVAAGRKPVGTTPPELAARLRGHAEHALALAGRIESEHRGDDRELARTLSDIRSMALLGRYYALKIEAATGLAMFRAIGAESQRRRAVAAITAAQGCWLEYAALAAGKYRNPLWTNRVGHVDWRELEREVARDVEIVSGRGREAKRQGADQ